MQKQKLVSWLLRLSIASVFLYAAVAATLQPDNWVGYLPDVARKMFSESLLLMGFSAFQGVLALWILSSKKQLWSGLLAAVTLLAIMTVNSGQMDILFRDLAIFFAALALAFSGV